MEHQPTYTNKQIALQEATKIVGEIGTSRVLERAKQYNDWLEGKEKSGGQYSVKSEVLPSLRPQDGAY